MENLRFKVLSSEEVGVICDKAKKFLSTKGVQVDHQEALKRLSKAGALVNMATQMVLLPEDVIEAALKVVPREVTLGGHSGRKDLTVPHPDGLFYTLINTGSRNYLDPETNTFNPLTVANMAEWAQLCEAVDEIDCCSINTPRDVPDETCDIHALRIVLENTRKHTILQPFSFEGVKYLFELAVAAVGSKEEYRKRPLLSPFVCFNSPYLLADYNAEILLQCAEHKSSISADSLPSIGATSPITLAGTVLLAVSEVLATSVMAQLLAEGTPILARPLIWGLDMATSRATHCSIDNILTDAAAVQVFKEGFKIPAMNYAFGNDSYLPDEEASIQSAQRGLLLTLAGADVVGAAGRMNAMSASSPVQLMIDKGLVNIFKQAKKGARVDDETLAWDDLMDTAPGTGQFLDRLHTMKHCREALRSELFVTEPYDTWKAAGGKDLRTRALDKYRETKKSLKPLDLPEELKREFDCIVKHADEHLVK
ncbi:trimethylamine methyltransferase family protein [Chloroflexota bacterium]